MTKKIKNNEIIVPVGEEGQDFQTGNFLNAIDHINNWYQEKCSDFTVEEAAAALRLYADKIAGSFE